MPENVGFVVTRAVAIEGYIREKLFALDKTENVEI
jgi:hypothetical protein